VSQVWAIARLDFRVWRRTPWAVAAAVVPALGMALLVMVLTWSVTRQPVALVVEGRGPQAAAMAQIVRADTEAYAVRETDLAHAQQLLTTQQVAAVIVVPATFDQGVAAGRASLDLTLNNVDIDFGDDIRRAVDRSVAEFDAPQLGASLERTGASQGIVVPNPYRVDVAEHDLRKTTVTYLKYQAVPVVVLLVIDVGVLGAAFLGARDRERGTRAATSVAPVTRTSVLLGRLVGILLAVASTVVPVCAALMAAHVVRVPAAHLAPLAAVLAVTAVVAAGIGVLLGSFVPHPSTVALVAITVASYLFFLGGGFTTVAFLPGWLQAASRAVPTTYAIDATRQALFYPDLRNVATDLLALCAFAVGGAVAVGVAVRERT
jgi:ABC-type multidrug transport system permease subunit